MSTKQVINTFLKNLKNKNIKPLIKDRKPILLIDQDDVLAKYVDRVLSICNSVYNTNYTLNDITNWNITSIIKENIEGIMFNPTIYNDLELVEGCTEVLKFLIKYELCEIYIVTAAHPTVCGNKHQWVKDLLPFFPAENMIFTTHKNLIQGDILFDDGPHNVLKFKNGEPILFDKPYNKDVKDIKRVSDWEEFLIYVLNKFYPCNKEIQQ